MSDVLSLLSGATNTSLSSLTQNSNGTITQTERLFTVRPRQANTVNVPGGQRGQRATIRLLSTNNATSLSRASTTTAGLGGGSLSASGSSLDNALNGNNTDQGYADFFITDVHCNLDEKLQITEVFGDGEVAYYFGRQPILMNFSGYVFDSQDNSWFVNWLTMYGQVMRGSALAQNYELLKIILPNMYVIGTMTNMSWAQNSASDTNINFSFQFMVKQLVPTAVIAYGVPTSNAASLINFSSVPGFLSQSGVNSVASSAAAAQSVIQNPLSTTSDIAASMTGIGSGLSAGISDISNYGYTPGVGTVTDSSGSSLASTVGGALNSAASSVVNVFNSISANLAGVRASLFSPIYGILSSLTKLINNVVGTAASVFGALSSVVNSVLGDIASVASLATNLINIVNNTLGDVIGIAGALDATGRLALGSLLNEAGVIANAPESIFQSLAVMVGNGQIPANVGWLTDSPISSLSSGTTPTSKLALLSSGPPFTAQSGAFL